MASSREALIKVLDAIEISALSFCSESQWADVRANVLAAGSVGEASKTAQEVLRKAARRSFGSRSEAARYAASIRWGNRGGSAGTGGGEASASVVVSPPEQGESPYATEAARVQQERERMGQYAVEQARQMAENRRLDQLQNGLGIAGRGVSGVLYEPISAEAPSAQQMKAFAGKAQVGGDNKLIEYETPTGDKYLMPSNPTFAMRSIRGATSITPKGSWTPDRPEEIRQSMANSAARVFNVQQERIAGMSSAELKANTVQPAGIVRQGVPASSRPNAKVDYMDLIVLDKGGSTLMVDARKFALAQRTFPNATVVQPVKDQSVNFVDRDGTVVAVLMPMRLQTPSTADFQQRAASMIAAGVSSE